MSVGGNSLDGVGVGGLEGVCLCLCVPSATVNSGDGQFAYELWRQKWANRGVAINTAKGRRFHGNRCPLAEIYGERASSPKHLEDDHF